jgi:hypothetical protein
MDGFIRVVHKHTPLAHQLWQIYFPQKLLVEFEKGSCRVVPHHKLNGEMKGFKKDYKKLAYASDASLDLLLNSAGSAEAQKVAESLHGQFGQLLMIYEH